MKRSEPNRKANIWVARAIPVLLLGIIGYASWVLTKKLCIDYLLSPPLSLTSRQQPAAAIAILTIYYLLLLWTLTCYGRLLYVVFRDPGLVPRGSQYYVEKQRRKAASQSHRRGKRLDDEKSSESDSAHDTDRPPTGASATSSGDALRVGDFWRRDVFACKYDGRPDFCSTCYNWKPDRAHHCSELSRCVLKMDHFCPWVGGVVGEMSFKFFIQFTFWAALFCLHVLISFAFFTAQRNHAEGTIDVHWAVVLGLAGLFFLFSAGMCMSSMQFAFINSTTIENLSRKQKVWYLAVYIPTHTLQGLSQPDRDKLRLITYPRPPEEQLQVLNRNGTTDPSNGSTTPQVVSSSVGKPPSIEQQRTFAIVETLPGANPWNLGPLANFRDVMGHGILDWLTPFRRSPCTNHDSQESFYKTGPVLQHIKQETGLLEDVNGVVLRPRGRRHKKRRQRRHPH